MDSGATLWSKNLPLDAVIHRFTVGRDPQLDLALYGFDCVASAAHVRMLGKVGLLADIDVASLLPALAAEHAKSLAGGIEITPSQEDCHTALEAALTLRCGQAGKRVHLGRSRNDQVLTALRLYLRAQTLSLTGSVLSLASTLHAFAQRYQDAAMPGFTHMRRAMPASFGLWATAFAEGLVEELDAATGLHARLDRCPLGAAAGFGVPLPLDRRYSATLLGFAKVQRAPMDCMNSRGRHEQALLDWCVSIAGTLEKLLWDLALFSSEEFGFLSLPDAFTTGSSIMPQKRNPDVVELARGKCRALRGIAETHRNIMSGLPSSYHRDFQLGKAPLMEGVTTLSDVLDALNRLFPALQVHTTTAAAACTPELHAAAAAYQLVAGGMAFRDAYGVIAGQISAGSFVPPTQAQAVAHIGHAQNLGLELLAAEIAAHRSALDTRVAHAQQITHSIWTFAEANETFGFQVLPRQNKKDA
jgi:argininosuccinate lyase